MNDWFLPAFSDDVAEVQRGVEEDVLDRGRPARGAARDDHTAVRGRLDQRPDWIIINNIIH